MCDLLAWRVESDWDPRPGSFAAKCKHRTTGAIPSPSLGLSRSFLRAPVVAAWTSRSCALNQQPFPTVFAAVQPTAGAFPSCGQLAGALERLLSRVTGFHLCRRVTGCMQVGE
jgi:hypothetical protein